MAKKKAAKKKAAKKKATRKKTTSRQASKKTSARKTTQKKSAVKSSAAKKAASKKAVAAKKSGDPVKKKAAPRPSAAPAAPAAPAPPARKVVKKRKGVRRATTTAGLRSGKPVRKLGRSQIPIDAPLDIVFQNDQSAREAFVFLGIHTVRELEQFEPDELVRRLTSPAKQTVGRIRKILAMNNRSLEQDEAFALEFKERLSQTHTMS
jgi:hypothetical protein